MRRFKFALILTIFIIVNMITCVYAADLKTTLDVIKNASETKYLENDQGYISKTIVDSNSDTGEVTVELKISNKAKEIENNAQYENTEIYLMVQENIVNDTEKFEKRLQDIENLSRKILNYNSKTKIGIVGIKGTVIDTYINDQGKMIIGDKDEGWENGTANDSEIVVNLTNNIDDIKNGFQNMNSSKTKYYTNLQAAIRLANKSYSNNVNKILISLYDDIPSIAIGVKNAVSNATENSVKLKYDNIATYTKNEILTLKSSGISFILLRPADTSYDETWYSTRTGEKLFDFDGSPYVQKLYGTIENPTYGKMYSYDTTNIDTIITENIYKDVANLIQPDMNTVKILDYFPSVITENFEFSYVGDASVGLRSETINEETKSIDWSIETLKGEEVATLKYKLKIKDMKNMDLLDKVLSTNEKVTLTYNDTDSKAYTVELISSPQIRLTKVIDPLTATVSYNQSAETTENVTATIATNKKVNKVEGWTLSEDGKMLTKVYSKNATEIVHLVDEDNLTKDVEIRISNILVKDDKTVAEGVLPYTGTGVQVALAVVAVIAISGGVAYFKYSKLKGI